MSAGFHVAKIIPAMPAGQTVQVCPVCHFAPSVSKMACHTSAGQLLVARGGQVNGAVGELAAGMASQKSRQLQPLRAHCSANKLAVIVISPARVIEIVANLAVLPLADEHRLVDDQHRRRLRQLDTCRKHVECQVGFVSGGAESGCGSSDRLAGLSEAGCSFAGCPGRCRWQPTARHRAAGAADLPAGGERRPTCAARSRAERSDGSFGSSFSW